MRILAIETSCDETAISVLKSNKTNWEILSGVVSSQVKLHAKWGGVVPGLAKREHLKNLPIVFKKAISKAGIKNFEKEIDLIAVTNGPGLEPALWTGVNFAKDLAEKYNKSILPVNHMEGHLFSVLLEQKNEITNSKLQILNKHKSSKSKIKNNTIIQFPAIALLVSGGHTQLILVKDWFDYKILGETRDDAVGEAFDKVARMLDLGYPGGPAISRFADKWKSEFLNSKSETNPKSKIQNPKISLPRPMMNTKDYDFSFSGLKTAVLYKTKEFSRLTKKIKSEMCYEFQQAVIDVLISKTIKATKEYKAKTVILGGGVSANRELREQMKKSVLEKIPDSKLIIPDSVFCGDNAAMIALATHFRLQKNKISPVEGADMKADGNLRII
ncbi:MAG: tRNA (adenosine(37)-N6)-threonylcarbamoyltransferase complex transferase subunit TsaD [Candidatus Marinimicrobia bacterium]|nr:tRNA (adenosine(37)-N6)-threonylcarbamoyltransferase complex transferase subunit TsaD [Candidatus Neomarinimicrobiota bacterium]